MEINNYTSKGLVDTRASMFVLIISMVKELEVMHLVPKSKLYKMASRVVA